MAKDEKTKKKPDIHGEVDQETYQKAIALKDQRGFLSWGELLTDLINQAPILPSELLKKIDSFFIEGTYTEKLTVMIDTFLKWHEKFPYLNIQKEITPEDADFPPCPLTQAVYWEGEFLGFHCRAIKPLAFRLPIMKVGKLTLQITTPQNCWDCIELRKEVSTGVGSIGLPTLEQIERHKIRMKEIKEQRKTQSEREITNKLRDAGLRETSLTHAQIKEVFNCLCYNNAKQKWKDISKASEKTGISRPTIYKLLKAFPKGID
jgi:hypothetical protein